MPTYDEDRWRAMTGAVEAEQWEAAQARAFSAAEELADQRERWEEYLAVMAYAAIASPGPLAVVRILAEVGARAVALGSAVVRG